MHPSSRTLRISPPCSFDPDIYPLARDLAARSLSAGIQDGWFQEKLERLAVAVYVRIDRCLSGAPIIAQQNHLQHVRETLHELAAGVDVAYESGILAVYPAREIRDLLRKIHGRVLACLHEAPPVKRSATGAAIPLRRMERDDSPSTESASH